MRATRPSSAAAAAAAAGSPIVILDDDTPAALSNNMRQQLHLQTPQRAGIQANRRKGTPVRTLSIAPNPSNPHAAAAQAAAPAPRRRLIAQRMQAAAARQPAQVARVGQRRSSNSSGSSAEQVDVVADAALARKLAQEEEDRLLAQQLMQDEERSAQVGHVLHKHTLCQVAVWLELSRTLDTEFTAVFFSLKACTLAACPPNSASVYTVLHSTYSSASCRVGVNQASVPQPAP
jgi:hypothetical protein